MSFSVTTIQFTSNKNCFVALPADVSKQSSKENSVHVFELNYGEDKKAYVSWSGETTRSSTGADGILKINGLYASKLELKDNEQVIVRSLNAVPYSKQVSVEPLSYDDWEILERNAVFVESHLQDQLRVVWKNQIFPVWVEKSICLFLKIAAIEPDDDCVILTDDTEVIVSPKIRNSVIGQKSNQSDGSSWSNQSEKTLHKEQSFKKTRDKSLSPSKGNKAKVPKSLDFFKATEFEDALSPSESTDFDNSPMWRWKDWIPWLLGVHNASSDFMHTNKKISVDTQKETFPVHSDIPGGVNFTFRVQALKEKSELRKGGKTFISTIDVSEKRLEQKCLYLQQPNIVFVNTEDIQDQIIDKDIEIPDMFFAKLIKLKSPKEELAIAEKENSKLNKKNSQNSLKNIDTENFKFNDEEQNHINCIVRVVVVSGKKSFKNKYLNAIVDEVLEEQPCLHGHVIIPNILRRLMNLDVTGRIWLKTVESIPVKTNSCLFHPVGSLPTTVTNHMIQMAFKSWLKQSTDQSLPLVVFQGLLVKFPIYHDTCLEFQLTFLDDRHTSADDIYCLMYPGHIPSCGLASNFKNADFKLSKGPLVSMIQYTDVSKFDPQVPTIQLKQLGGLREYSTQALSHLETCLGVNPFSNSMFSKTTPGIRNGLLLITGAKGSGKTSFARAVCRHFAELPNLAHTTIVDCKPLRGKRPDSILKVLEVIFDEAVWRQPSIILLDDLDLAAPAPSGPEAEMSGEAIYGARIAEVLKDILRKEICNGSRIGIIATCQSRNSIHPLLVASRGTHFVQETINMVPPDKARRKDILRTILQNRPNISMKSEDNLNFDWLLSKSEGFVASDFDSLVSRAVHAQVLIHGYNQNSDNEVLLTQKEFDIAMDGFTPASIRNVPLHTSGELGWEDVGGLTEVKKTLRETLEWPSKYPVLFANCPLRLRSGLLLYGAPGTGKTLLAGVVAKECGVNFISIKGPELLSKYIGASEQAVRDTFIRAQSAKPCILFFDEFDSIAPRRGHDNTGVTDRVVNQLLTQLDGVEGLEGVYVLAATSRPDLIDPALLRPGRLDRSVACNLPNKDERLKILQALIRNIKIGDDVDLAYFADKCEHFTGADFKALLYNAQLESIHEVTGRLMNDDVRETQSEPSVRLSRISPRRSQTNLLGQKVVIQERRKSWIDKRVIYVPKLEEGVSEISDEMADKLNFQVEQIKAKLKVTKSTEPIHSSDNLFSPLAASKTQMMEVKQCHLLKALEKTRPSVNEEERHKYQTIYENFVSSRGGNFGPGIPDLEQRQTLA